jgi:protein subunit release factor A
VAKADQLSLDPSDVGYLKMSPRSRGKPGAPITDTRSTVLTLTHRPTGLQVTGEVPAGRYTNAQMNARQDALHQTLMAELTALVAKKLRLPGR